MFWLLLIPFFIYLVLFVTAALYLRNPAVWTYNPLLQPVSVSIIVPCKNEESSLPSLLADLSLQNYPEDSFEIIVVDDHSSDNTLIVAEEFSGIRNLKVISNAGNGKKHAIRTGVQSSSSELIITTDADCRVGKVWVGTIASFYAACRPALIIGPVKLKERKGVLFVFQHIEWLGLQGITAGYALAGRPVMCNGANLAFTRKTFMENCEDLNYTIPSGDDIFLLHSVKSKQGPSILWLNSREADVTTEPAYSIQELLKQRARWISKAGSYRDAFTIFLSAVVFITVSLLGLMLVAALLNIKFLPFFLAGFTIKSFADALLIRTTANLYKQKSFLRWLFPLQLLYPLYLAAVLIRLIPGLFSREKL